MSYRRTIDPQQNGLPRDESRQPLCVHYRSKAMYVTGDLQPGHADEEHNHDQNCWCNLTQRVFGPDAQVACLDQCTAGRECFRDV